MNLIKTSLLNGIAVATKLATTVALNKLIAVYVGPAGYAVIGQFQSLVAMLAAFASGGINNGVTKYTAEHRDDEDKQQSLWRTAATLGLLGSCSLALLIILARHTLAEWTLGDRGLANIMFWLAGAMVLMVMNGLMLAALSGLRAVRIFVIANIAGSLITALVASALVLKLGLYGALLALSISQGLACLSTAFLFLRLRPTPLRAFFGRIDPAIARQLGTFALMSLASALLVPLAQMLIRDGIATQLGWSPAGLWQAMVKISETHLMLLTTSLSLYFLPRFSELRTGKELRREVWRGIGFVLPVVLTTSLLLYLLRTPLIELLLSDQFLPLVDVLGWQLLGDALKICSWILSYVLLSQAQAKSFIATEMLFSALLVILTLTGVALDGLRGSAIAYALTYGLYGLTMLFLFRNLTATQMDGSIASEDPEAPA